MNIRNYILEASTYAILKNRDIVNAVKRTGIISESESEDEIAMELHVALDYYLYHFNEDSSRIHKLRALQRQDQYRPSRMEDYDLYELENEYPLTFDALEALIEAFESKEMYKHFRKEHRAGKLKRLRGPVKDFLTSLFLPPLGD